MTRKPRKSRDEIVDELVREDETFRRLKERLERDGVPTGSDQASYDARTKLLEEGLARHGRRRESS